MDLKEKNSTNLDLETVRLSQEKNKEKAESFKVIPENGFNHVSGDTVKNSNMVKVNGDSAHDGADEKMLTNGEEKEVLHLKEVEVKFTASEKNGDHAKIDIGNVEKQTFTGMTKEELMKYANDPFWVRLRWILFVFFWALWVAMLVGAILIIVYAPKCAAPTNLAWWKQGPLVTINGNEPDDKVKEIEKFGAKGVVYSLDPTKTYFVDNEDVETKIKTLVEKYKAANINVIMDLTPNYITNEDKLYIDARNDTSLRAALVVTSQGNALNTWRSVLNENAWSTFDNENKILSQFGQNRFDLRLNNDIAKTKFKGVLSHLIGLGVHGFRLDNSKHFIISSELKDEKPSGKAETTVGDYNFHTHTQTTFVEGLGGLLAEFKHLVANQTKGLGFLTIKDDITYNPEVYKINELFGFDLGPHDNQVHKLLAEDNVSVSRKLNSAFATMQERFGESTWMQWWYNKQDFTSGLDASTYNIFMFLLPGVPIVDLEALNYATNMTELMKKLSDNRLTPVFMHGDFKFFNDVNSTVFGYTRVKSGNPGLFVVLNPTNEAVVASFNVTHVQSELSVEARSDVYALDVNKDHGLKNKIPMTKVPLLPRSAAVFTFVPK